MHGKLPWKRGLTFMLSRPFDTLLQQTTPRATIAVAGASNHPLKYGYLVTKFLAAQGYTVWPISSDESAVHGIPTYPDVASLPAAPDIISTVTPPRATLALIREAILKGCEHLWLQPGSFNITVLSKAAMSGMLIESQRCIMVVSAQWLGEPTSGSTGLQ
ncbi:MAG: CoA-binding protein [Myxococcota bacterium]|nr:CoA-binding protein [Myxococcota bacterium]